MKKWNPFSRSRKKPEEVNRVATKGLGKDATGRYSLFQLFVLAYLYEAELEKNVLKEGEFSKRIKMTKQDFLAVTPKEILPTPEKVESDLTDLRRYLALHDNHYEYYLDHTHGVYFVRKYLEPLVKIRDPQQYESVRKQFESVIENTQGSNEVKNFFSGFLDKLKDKTEDEIIKEIFAGIRQYGPGVFTVFVQGLGSPI